MIVLCKEDYVVVMHGNLGKKYSSRLIERLTSCVLKGGMKIGEGVLIDGGRKAHE